LLFPWSRARGMKAGAAGLFLLFLFFFPEKNPSNITAHTTPVVLFLSILRTLEGSRGWDMKPFARGVLIAIQAAGLCSLKMNIIPPCVIFLGMFHAFEFSRSVNRKNVVFEAALTATLTAACLFPWMLSLKHSSGTLLFPLLGKGYHGSVYGLLEMPYQGISIGLWLKSMLIAATNAYIFIPVIVGFILFRDGRPIRGGREALFSLFVACVVSYPIVFFSVGGFAPMYYTLSFTFPTLLALMVHALSERSDSGGRTHASIAAIILAAFLVGCSWNQFFMRYQDYMRNVVSGIRNRPLISSERAAPYLSAQRSVPPGAVIFERLDIPFVLDFRRNPVYVVDWPGTVSPPPGIPSYKEGPEPLAKYLLSKKIKYIMYSYGNEAGYHEDYAKERSSLGYSWNTQTAMNTIGFQKNLSALGKTREKIFDDGSILVIDISRKAALLK
ncbi:MAG TPA: hypothetical protein PLQ76_04170, partial [bacterium]|nr:hypothetical protein [bacterium]